MLAGRAVRTPDDGAGHPLSFWLLVVTFLLLAAVLIAEGLHHPTVGLRAT